MQWYRTPFDTACLCLSAFAIYLSVWPVCLLFGRYRQVAGKQANGRQAANLAEARRPGRPTCSRGQCLSI